MPYERNEMVKHLDIYNLAHDDTFRKRVQCAVYLAGRDVLNDGLDKSSARHILARQSQSLEDFVLDRFAWACASNPSILAAEVQSAGSSLDGDLDFVVASVWDGVANS